MAKASQKKTKTRSRKTPTQKPVKKQARSTSRKTSATKRTRTRDKQSAETSRTPFKERVEKILADRTTDRDTNAKIDTAQPKPVRHGFIALSLIKYERPVIQVARTTGVVFIMIGALFSLTALDRISVASHSMLAAETISSTDADSDSGDDSSYSSSSVEGSLSGSTNDTEDSIDETPDVVFDVPLGTPVAGSLDVLMTVPYAEKVHVSLFYKDGQESFTLGRAELVDENTWFIDWDTTAYHDGEYRVIAVVDNQFGTYEDKTDGYVLVENFDDASDDTTSTTSDETSTTADTSTTSTYEPPVEIVPNEDEPFSGNVDFSVYVENALSVKFAARDVETNTRHTLGFAVQHDISEWRFRWDTDEYPDGDYALVAYVQNAETTYDTDPVRYTIQNEDTTAATTNDDALLEEENEESLDETTTTTETELTEPPKAVLQVLADEPLSGIVPLRIEVTRADFIEVYARPEMSHTPHFLGLARNVSPGVWRHDLDTTQTPNGTYEVFARVKNEYGLLESNLETVKIYNEPASTMSSSNTTDRYEEIEQEIDTATTDSIGTGQADADTPRGDADSEADTIARDLFAEFDNEIDTELQRLASALRKGDEEDIRYAKARIEELRRRILHAALDDVDSSELTTRIDGRLTGMMDRLVADTERTEEIIRNRVGDAVREDTDGDGIPDFDETTIYGTDPQSADTDGDGFNDGTEILRGYDPLNSEPEVAVRYESPRESGVVREDVVSVTGITALEPDESDEIRDGVRPQAVITGTGLPNSFVTLYVFSTPIVVTVRTNEDGSWSYTFDKELEDGEHEVYVGVTDNAGRIIAKSNPFRFVKEAQAFTPVDAGSAGTAAAAPPETGEPNLLSEGMITLVLSLSVVSIGLVLLLLGIHLRNRPEPLSSEAHA